MTAMLSSMDISWMARPAWMTAMHRVHAVTADWAAGLDIGSSSCIRCTFGAGSAEMFAFDVIFERSRTRSSSEYASDARVGRIRASGAQRQRSP
jgi:hypothetical protein